MNLRNAYLPEREPPRRVTSPSRSAANQKNREKMLDFCLVRLPRTGRVSKQAKKICGKLLKKRGLEEDKGAKNIF